MSKEVMVSEMKRMYKQFALLVALILVAGLKGERLSVEERLSLSFSGIAITNGTSLLLKVKDIDQEVLYVRYGGMGAFHPVTNGSVHVIEKKQTFSFRYSRSPIMTISLVEDVDVEKRFPHVPLEFHQSKGGVFILEDEQNVTLISPFGNVSYTLGDENVRSFHFPFHGIWRDRREFDLWRIGKPYRGRIDDVRKRVASEKADAESIHEYVGKRFAPEMASVVFSGDSTCAKLSVSLDGEDRFPQFGKAVLKVEKAGDGTHLLALSLLPAAGSGFSRQYLFDRSGHLIWHMARDSSKRNKDGAFDGPDGFSLFELAPNGTIRRAFFGNVLPLLVVTERTFFFTGDGELVRKFLSDFVAASRRGE